MSSMPTALADTEDPMTRNMIMAEVLAFISAQGYHYVLSKGAPYTEIPPRGSSLNCQAVARLAKKIAEERHGLQGLKIVYYSNNEGFIVLGNPGLLALGTDQPPLTSLTAKCWEFENHYRVQDPLGFNKVFDPIFGSSGSLNPKGILFSTKTKLSPNGMVMETIYGERYKVSKGGGLSKCEELNKLPVPPRYIIDDSSFRVVV